MQKLFGWILFLLGALETGVAIGSGAFPLAIVGIILMIYGYVKSHKKNVK
jgi:hypothetical protein